MLECCGQLSLTASYKSDCDQVNFVKHYIGNPRLICHVLKSKDSDLIVFRRISYILSFCCIRHRYRFIFQSSKLKAMDRLAQKLVSFSHHVYLKHQKSNSMKE